MKNKKAQVGVGGLGITIIALVLASVLLVFGLIILQELRDTDAMLNSFSIASESLVNMTNMTARTVIHANDPGFASFAVSAVVNHTDAAVINDSLYTVDAAAGTVIATNLAQISSFANHTWNFTYTFVSGEDAYIGANASIIGLATFANFWEIIVLAIVISIVIGLLLVVFGTRRTR